MRAAGLAPSEIQSGWINLLDDSSLYGWSPGNGSSWHVDKGVLGSQNGAASELRSNFPLADFQLTCEYRLSGSAKLLLRVIPSSTHEKRAFEADLSASSNSSWTSFSLTAEGSHLDGQIDGKAKSETDEAGIASGVLKFIVPAGSHLEIRRLTAHPAGLNSIFNGDNLDGWALMKPKPDAAQGSHKFLKVLPLPGGKKNEEKALWTVHSGTLHGERGPGQIHTDSAYDNVVLQFQYSSKRRSSRSDAQLVLRADPNRLADGYRIPLSEQSKSTPGSLLDIHAARAVGALMEPVTETVIMNGRHMDVWIDGRLVNDYEDPRPPGPDLTKEARIGAAPIAIASLDESASLDIRNMQLAALKGEEPKVAKSAATPATAAATPAASQITAPLPSAQQSANAPAPAQDAALTQLLQAQNRQQEQQQRTGALMQQALASSDPKTQVQLYDQILSIDPSNQAAFSGRKEALAKLEASNAAEAIKEQLASKQSTESNQRVQSEQNAFSDAQAAFLRGDLTTAQREIGMAQKLAPGDPNVTQLANLITARVRQRRNILYLAGGGGFCGLLGLVYWLLRRRKQGTPWLYLIEGTNVAKEYALKAKVTRIGAVPNDGTLQNDIVLNDPERSVSRFHCELHSVKNRVYVVDCDSANGTYVNGQRVRPQKPALVRRGNQIRLGSAQVLQLAYKEKAS